MRRHHFGLVFSVAIGGVIMACVAGAALPDPPVGQVASYLGENGNDKVGKTAAGVGDVNGDGFDDFIIGAKDSDDGGDKAGKVYLVLGKSTGWAEDVALSEADASFLGENEDDKAGEGIAGVGDVNGDGYDDFLIGAPNNEDGDDKAGKVYIIFGKPTGWATGTSLSAADASFVGENEDDKAGKAVAGVGDVNNDGYDDFIIGAKDNEDGGNKAGKVYLILGKGTGWAADVSLSGADASFVGENNDDKAGECVAGAGDVNGDGYDDFLIGAPENDDGGDKAGKVYLVLGKATGWVNGVDLAAAGTSFVGEYAGDKAGKTVAGAGDANGDGYDDFIIGARENDHGGSKAGQVYLVLGGSAGMAPSIDLSGVDASFVGENSNDKVGEYISAAGDVNNDGYDDFIIGAKENDDGGDKAGKAYLIMGNESDWTWRTDLSTVDETYLGESAGDKFGEGVFAAGDLNNDGRAEFGVASPEEDTAGDKAGKVYIHFAVSGGLTVVSWQEAAPN